MSRLFRFLKSNRGSAPVVGFVLLVPLLAVLIYGAAWLGQMVDVQNVTEEAARAGARWLASHPGDIEGAKQKAADVVLGSFTVQKDIDPKDGPKKDKLLGRLTRVGNKYYIGGNRVKPATEAVRQDMERLLNRVVLADGSWAEANVFEAKVATTNPPETQTVQQQGGNSAGQPGTQGSQTVNQVTRPGPFQAAVLAQYGQGIWGTWWTPPAGSGQTVSTNTALRLSVNYHRANVWSNPWTPPGGGKIKRLHIKGKSETRYDYGYVYGWNGSSWVELAKRCSPPGRILEYDEWIDVSNQNITQIRTRLTTDGSVLYNPTYVDVPEVELEGTGGWPDQEARWIWSHAGAAGCAPNGQEVRLEHDFWVYDYATYRLSATADDYLRVRVDVTDVLNHGGTGFKTWDYWPKDHSYPKAPAYPQSGFHRMVVSAGNDYGPAGVLLTFQHTGWHWDTSYPGYHAYGNGHRYYYPWIRVRQNQWVTVTAKDSSGNPRAIYVWDGSRNFYGYGTLSFYAYANPSDTTGSPAYLVHVASSTDYNDVVVSFEKPNPVMRSDSSWQYGPVDGVRYGQATLPQRVIPEAEFTVKINATNTGKREWFASRPSWWPNNWNSPDSWQTNFSYHWYDDKGNLIIQDGLRTGLPYNIPSGGTVNLDLKVKAPSQPGRYRLVIDGVQERCAWYGPLQGVNWPTLEAWIDVGGLDYSVSYDPAQVPKYMEAGKTYTLQVRAKNTGSLAWTPEGSFGLAYHWYDKNSGKTVVWDGTRDYVDYAVAPGQTYAFSLPVTAPSQPGVYTLEIDMVREGVTWFKNKGSPILRADVEVPQGDVLKGLLTYDGEDYWVGNIMVRSAGLDLSKYAGRSVILWGQNTGQKERFFRVTSIQEYDPGDWKAVSTFYPDKDVLCSDPVRGDPDAPPGDPAGQRRADGYAYCRVTYHYPVPIRKFWEWTSGRHIWKGAEPPSKNVIGEAFFKSGESGN